MKNTIEKSATPILANANSRCGRALREMVPCTIDNADPAPMPAMKWAGMSAANPSSLMIAPNASAPSRKPTAAINCGRSDANRGASAMLVRNTPAV